MANAGSFQGREPCGGRTQRKIGNAGCGAAAENLKDSKLAPGRCRCLLKDAYTMVSIVHIIAESGHLPALQKRHVCLHGSSSPLANPPVSPTEIMG